VRIARGVHALLVAAIAWGAFAFGAVYPWAYWPLVAAAVAIAASSLAIRVAQPRDLARRLLPFALALFAAAACVQLVPLPRDTIARVSPETVRFLDQLNPAFAMSAAEAHPLSIAPDATAAGLLLFAGFAALVLACARLFSALGARAFARAVAIAGVVLALTGIVQQSLSSGRIYGFWQTVDGGTPYGPFVNKNHFAGWMLMALPLTLGLLMGGIARAMRGVRPAWRDRLVWLSSPEASGLILTGGAAVVMAIALILTMSRSGVSAFALAVALTGAFVARRRWSAARAATAFAYLALLVIVAVGWAGAGVLAARFSDADWSELNARRGAWSDAADIAARFPIAGTGLDTYGRAMVLYQRHDREEHYYTEAHNDYLQLAAEGGLLLTIPAAICVLLFTAAVWQRFRDEPSVGAHWLRVGAVTGLAAVALQDTVDFSLQMPGNAALFAALCGIALHRLPERKPS
jgi:O-antigen ligase